MESQYFDCQCTHFDHVIRFTVDEVDGDVWVETRLSHFLPWWKRALVAVAYTFGLGSSRLGHYAECQLRKEDMQRLYDVMNQASLIKHIRASRVPSEKPLIKG